MSAFITDQYGEMLTQGLRGCDACDEAIQAARRMAARSGEVVYLHDDDGEWEVRPDGSRVEVRYE